MFKSDIIKPKNAREDQKQNISGNNSPRDIFRTVPSFFFFLFKMICISVDTLIK